MKLPHLAHEIEGYPTTARDLCWLFLGHLISTGMSRSVYQHATDPTLVVKYEHGDTHQNLIEWKVWEEIQYTPFAKHFAPVVAMSPNGHFLIQKKCQMPLEKNYPKRVPDFFTDLKYSNYGILDGKFVCFDYGSTKVVRGFSKKMRKADWA